MILAKVGKDAGQNVVRSDQDDYPVGLGTDHAAQTPDDVERQVTAHPQVDEPKPAVLRSALQLGDPPVGSLGRGGARADARHRFDRAGMHDLIIRASPIAPTSGLSVAATSSSRSRNSWVSRVKRDVVGLVMLGQFGVLGRDPVGQAGELAVGRGQLLLGGAPLRRRTSLAALRRWCVGAPAMPCERAASRRYSSMPPGRWRNRPSRIAYC